MRGLLVFAALLAAERPSWALEGRDASGPPSVVALVEPADGGVRTLCSGVIVASRFVLTAAHCVGTSKLASLRVMVGDRVSAPSEEIAVARAVPHPRWSGTADDARRGHDIAVLELGAATSIEPAELPSGDAPVDGAMVDVLAYGVTLRGEPGSAGTRRIGETRVAGLCPALVELGQEIAPCVGDSGGPVFLRGDTRQVVALISFGLPPGCIAPAFATRVSAHAGWIRDVISGRAPARCEGACANAEVCGRAVPPGEPPAPPAPASGCALGRRVPLDVGSALLVTVALVCARIRFDLRRRRGHRRGRC
jgi:hypothetical protein